MYVCMTVCVYDSMCAQMCACLCMCVRTGVQLCVCEREMENLRVVEKACGMKAVAEFQWTFWIVWLVFVVNTKVHHAVVVGGGGVSVQVGFVVVQLVHS